MFFEDEEYPAWSEECPVCHEAQDAHDTFEDVWFDMSEVRTCTTIAEYHCNHCGHDFVIQREYELVAKKPRFVVEVDGEEDHDY